MSVTKWKCNSHTVSLKSSRSRSSLMVVGEVSGLLGFTYLKDLSQLGGYAGKRLLSRYSTVMALFAWLALAT